MKLSHWAVVLLLLSCGPAMAADADHDGVLDERDRCAHTAQIKKVDAAFPYAPAVSEARRSTRPHAHPVDENGCELDSDSDGVKDSAD